MTTLDTLFAELVAIDPTLAAHATELKKMLAELIQTKPDLTIDPVFVAKLREEVYQHIGSRQTTWLTHLLQRPVLIATASMLMTLIVVAPLTYLLTSGGDLGYSARGVSAHKVQIAALSQERAFGSLAGQPATGKGGGGGGGNAGMMATAVPAPEARDTKMIALGEPSPALPTVYDYEYTGALPELAKDVTVLRRIPGKIGGTSSGNDLLASLGLNFFDGGRLQNLTLQNLSLVEDREFGFTISVDPMTGSISLFKNWQKWPDPMKHCQGITDGEAATRCYADSRIKLTDVPDDAAVIAVVRNFISQYAIDVSAYDDPQVDNGWRAQLQRQPADSQYVPDELSVIFPIKLGGAVVYEEWGGAVGLRVSYDIRTKRVSGLSGLSQETYESSSYAVATVENLKQAIHSGGRSTYMPGGQDIRHVTVRLGKPEQVLAKIYQWDAATSTNSELFVPALRFPVAEIPKDAENWFYRDAVTIPLAADLFQDGGDVIRPMPISPLVR